MSRASFTLFSLAVLVAPPAGAQEADLILIGARVWTGDSASPPAQAVAVRGNRILAAGPRADVLRQLPAWL